MASGSEHEAAGWASAIVRDLWEWALVIAGGAIAWIYRTVDAHGRMLEAHGARITAAEKHGDMIGKIAEDVAHIRGRFDEQDQRRHYGG